MSRLHLAGVEIRGSLPGQNAARLKQIHFAVPTSVLGSNTSIASAPASITDHRDASHLIANTKKSSAERQGDRHRRLIRFFPARFRNRPLRTGLIFYGLKAIHDVMTGASASPGENPPVPPSTFRLRLHHRVIHSSTAVRIRFFISTRDFDVLYHWWEKRIPIEIVEQSLGGSRPIPQTGKPLRQMSPSPMRSGKTTAGS